jgi:hypothetical protein
MKTKILLTILSFNLICISMGTNYNQDEINNIKQECENRNGHFSQPEGICFRKDQSCVIDLTSQINTLNGGVITESNNPVQSSVFNNQLNVKDNIHSGHNTNLSSSSNDHSTGSPLFTGSQSGTNSFMNF